MKKKNILLDENDDLEQISKKWQNYKKSDSDMSSSVLDTESEAEKKRGKNISERDEEEEDDQSERMTESQISSQPPKKMAQVQQTGKNFTKKSHLPQMIDQDTEAFKVKLDHLINVFKMDAVQEFMQMKKSMLEDQSDKIKEETERYLNMYEEKAQELLQTKTHLSEKIQECEIYEKRQEKISLVLLETKRKFWALKTIGKYFEGFKSFQKARKMKRRLKSQVLSHFNKNLLRRIKNAWNTYYSENRARNQQELTEKAHNEEIEELTARFNKEIQTLQERLTETSSALIQANQDKENMSENLKKAFMRGVCALNFEAMNVLQGQQGQPKEVEAATQNFTKTVNQMGNTIMGSTQQSINPAQQPQQQQPQNIVLVPQKQQEESTDDFLQTEQSLNNQKKTIVFFNESKIESKDHKWRDAPIVGVPKDNKENYQSSTLPSLLQTAQTNEEDDPEEGRVVRVNHNTVNRSVHFDKLKEPVQQQKAPPQPIKQPQPVNSSTSKSILKNTTSSLSSTNPKLKK